MGNSSRSNTCLLNDQNFRGFQSTVSGKTKFKFLSVSFYGNAHTIYGGYKKLLTFLFEKLHKEIL